MKKRLLTKNQIIGVLCKQKISFGNEIIKFLEGYINVKYGKKIYMEKKILLNDFYVLYIEYIKNDLRTIGSYKTRDMFEFNRFDKFLCPYFRKQKLMKLKNKIENK